MSDASQLLCSDRSGQGCLAAARGKGVSPVVGWLDYRLGKVRREDGLEQGTENRNATAQNGKVCFDYGPDRCVDVESVVVSRVQGLHSKDARNRSAIDG